MGAFLFGIWYKEMYGETHENTCSCVVLVHILLDYDSFVSHQNQKTILSLMLHTYSFARTQNLL